MKRMLWTLALTCLLAAPAFAGRECTARAPGAQETQKALALATDVFQALERSGAAVALVGRIGSDQSARGVRYTHVGYAQRDHAKGRWTVTHVLNICGEARSDIYDEGLANFYLDEVFAFESKVVIPSPAVQEGLLRALNGPLKRTLHEREYSLIAYPWVAKYQNSNGWALELAASALAGPGEVTTRAQAQAWLRRAGFVPNRIPIGPGERAGTRLFAANVRYGDHPDEAWQRQAYDVVAGDGVLDFLARADGASRSLVMRFGQPAQELAQVGGAAVAPAAARSAPVAAPARAAPVAAPAPAAAVAATAAPAPAAGSGLSPRAQILAGTRSLIVGYACREQGYLRQCQQLDTARCEQMVNASILECFAPISDAELTEAQQKSALATVEKVGWCAADMVDRQLGSAGKRAATPDGRSCADMHAYK